MFTTICPKCGREIDVAETDCPHCNSALAGEESSARKIQPKAPAPKAPPPKAQKAAPRAPARPEPSRRTAEAMPQLPSRRRRRARQQAWSIPPLYLAILAGFVAGAIGVAIYFSSPGTFGDRLKLESVDDQVQEGYGIASASLGEIEVSGVRTWWDAEAEAIKVRAVIVNHGDSPKSNLDFKVNLRPLDSDRSTSPLASFEFQLDGELGPHESRDVNAELASLAHPSALPKWSETRLELEQQ